MRSADIQGLHWLGKRVFRKSFRAAAGAFISVLLFGVAGAYAQVGTVFDQLEVDGCVYRSVKVLSVSPTTVTIGHSGGIAQLPLRALPVELQRRFGYVPEAEEIDALLREAERKHQESQSAAKPALQQPATRSVRPGSADTPLGRALSHFGAPPQLQRVDLRPRFRELELGTKNQGLRPSCAVFAVVGALEFQNAEATGHTEKLSEEYLIWATRRTLGVPAGEKRVIEDADGSDDDKRDAGFSLMEVLSALRAYGIPLQSEMPYKFGMGMEKIADPSDDIVASARSRRQIATYSVPGMNNSVRIANIIHALNEGVPVVVALRWPHWRTLYRSPVLSEQSPREGRSHAVTLVGYYSENGEISGLRFIFRNSWGIRWGAGGYGFAEIGYLQRNLLDAVVIEIK
jgi:C1A family cysteine protease